MTFPDKILIYGLGMMGSSLSLALQKSSPCTEVTGIVKTEEEKKSGMERRSADKIITEEEFLRTGDFTEFSLIIIALPVDVAAGKMSLIPENFSGFITDMGSVKNDIIAAGESRFANRYISSHPMTGSEESGLENGNAGLFGDRLCILCETEVSHREALEYIENFWKKLGMIVYRMSPESHDNIMAYLSHVPHMLSSAMTRWAVSSADVQSHTSQSEVPLNGGGFRDMARIAGSNPAMWEAIIRANKRNITGALENFIAECNAMLKALDDDQEGYWVEYFTASKNARNMILKKKQV